jgi:flagellar biosynthetic protein FliR
VTINAAALLEGQVYAFLLIFCRIGAILMSMPGIGETFVPPRIRLQFALLVRFILLPFLAPQLPAMPATAAGIVQQITLELGYGIFIGLVMRLLLGTLDMAGMLISIQTGLSNATILNPTVSSQGSITGVLLSMLGVVVILESGLLSMLFNSLVESYAVFKPGMLWPVGDIAHFYSQSLNDSFSMALRLVAPFMILGIAFQVTAGLVVKMIPQVQIFFIVAPLQILFGIAILAFSIGSIVHVWAMGFEDIYGRLFPVSAGL